jgi:hypothetical protein
MIKKISFLILLVIAIISFGCNVYDEIIDAAIVDQAGETTITVSPSPEASDTTSTSSASATSSLIFPP